MREDLTGVIDAVERRRCGGAQRGASCCCSALGTVGNVTPSWLASAVSSLLSRWWSLSVLPASARVAGSWARCRASWPTPISERLLCWFICMKLRSWDDGMPGAALAVPEGDSRHAQTLSTGDWCTRWG